MAKSEIDARRTELFESCLDLVSERFARLGTLSSRQANRLTLRASNQTDLLVELASVKQGYGLKAGEFITNTTVIVRNGPLLEVIKRLRLMNAEEVADGRLYQTGSLDYLKSDEAYALRLSDSVVDLAERIALDLERFTRAKVATVLAAKPDLVRLVLDRPDDFEKPFATVAAVLVLHQNLEDLQAFWDKTANTDSIWDRPTAARFGALKKAAAKPSQ